MKVDLERVEGNGPERYKVRVREDDSGVPVPNGTVIGLATRTGDTSWTFGARMTSDDTFDSTFTLSLTAKDTDELKSAIQARFGLLDVTADRLMDDTLEAFASHVLSPISSLATNTSSIGGLVKALAHQVALIAAGDVQEGKREEFFAMFAERVRDETASLVREHERRLALRVALSTILKAKGIGDILNGTAGGDDGSIKH